MADGLSPSESAQESWKYGRRWGELTILCRPLFVTSSSPFLYIFSLPLILLPPSLFLLPFFLFHSPSFSLPSFLPLLSFLFIFWLCVLSLWFSVHYFNPSKSHRSLSLLRSCSLMTLRVTLAMSRLPGQRPFPRQDQNRHWSIVSLSGYRSIQKIHRSSNVLD